MSDLQTTLAAALGPGYRLERELGGGGMSRVFLAEELSLGRRVVVKVLPPEFAADSGAERFQRETRLLAALQHPNIVPIITAGGDANLLWFTMPFIEGESLRDRLEREGELPVGEAVRLWAEILDALSHAHARGIVHRDIKPENVLLSGRHALVADFGIARALSSLVAGGRATATGLAIGTPAYMSPEQAVGESNVDARADIYAAALVMYEMLTGVMPFNERSPARLIVAHASQPVPPVRERRPQASPELEALLLRCLEKRPADRPQAAEEVLQAVAQLPDASGTPTPSRSLATGGARGGAAAAPAAARRGRRWLLGGLAVAAIVAAVAGVQQWRAKTAMPTVVVDSSRVGVMLMPPVFEPADSLLARGAIESLRASIKNDRRLIFVDPALEMPADADDRFKAGARSRDSLLRWLPDMGMHTHLTYTVARAGGGYLLSVSVRALQPDSSLYNRQLTAATITELPAVAETLAREATAALGAAFGRVRRPTPNGVMLGLGPDAARLAMEAAELFARRDYQGAAERYRAVLRADSTLALAWVQLGFSLGNAGLGTDERLRAMAAAYRHRGTIPIASGRRSIEAEYHRALGDWERAVQIIDEQRRNGDDVNPNNYGLLLGSLRRFDEAERVFARIRDTTYQVLGNANGNYVIALLDLGRVEEAAREVAAMRAVQGPQHPVVASAQGQLARYARNPDSLLALLRDQAESRLTSSARLGNLAAQRSAELMRGAVGAADVRLEERVALLRQASPSDVLAAQVGHVAEKAAVLGADPALQQELSTVFSRSAFDALAPLDRPWYSAMAALARLGRVEEARAISAQADRDIPAEFRRTFQLTLASGRLEIALATGDARAALEQARLRDRGSCVVCAWAGYARAWDLAGNADSALAYYDRYLDAKTSRAWDLDGAFHASFLLRSAELREGRGDVAGALARYRAFTELWRDADPALQPRVREVQARIARLEARRG